MKPLRSRSAPATGELIALTYELLDAHSDTAALVRRTTGARSEEPWPPGALLWAAHLDYLKALQRKAREIVAGGPSEEGSASTRGDRR